VNVQLSERIRYMGGQVGQWYESEDKCVRKIEYEDQCEDQCVQVLCWLAT
jgi:hypothetical protein